MELQVSRKAAEKILSLLFQNNAGLGSDSTIDAPLNGELTLASYLAIFNALDEAIPFNNNSMFLDLGSGQGKMVYCCHQYYSGLFPCIGVEIDQNRCDLSIHYLTKFIRIYPELNLSMNIMFGEIDFLQLKNFVRIFTLKY